MAIQTESKYIEEIENLKTAFISTIAQIGGLSAILADRIIESTKENPEEAILGSQLHQLLEKNNLTQDIMSQITPKKNPDEKVVGAMLGGSAGIAFFSFCAYHAIHDIQTSRDVAQAIGRGIVDTWIGTFSLPLIFSAQNMGQKIAAPLAHRQTRDGIRHFLEIEHVTPQAH